MNQTVAGLVSVTGTNIGTFRNTIGSASSAVLTIAGSGSYVYSLGTSANSGRITGSIQLVMSGTGKQTLGGGSDNTYSGGTVVSAGTLQIGAANSVPSSGGLTINGTGTFSSGATTGFANNLGALTLAGTPAISLGTGNHTLTFTTLTNTASTLTINGWTGSTFTTGTGGKLIFTDLNLTDDPAAANVTFASFLGNVNFTGFGAGTFIANAGGLELVPVPEPTTILGLAAGVLAFGTWVRRRRAAAAV